LSRKVFMLPGSICREDIPASFSWQEVSLPFSVETCVGLCKSRCAEAFHRAPALRRGSLFFRSGKKKSRAHEPFGSCALFQLSRKVFMLPGSICRENIPGSFSWQEVSLSFSVETCVTLCKKARVYAAL
jgi:hypothetical protein